MKVDVAILRNYSGLFPWILQGRFYAVIVIFILWWILITSRVVCSHSLILFVAAIVTTTIKLIQYITIQSREGSLSFKPENRSQELSKQLLKVVMWNRFFFPPQLLLINNFAFLWGWWINRLHSTWSRNDWGLEVPSFYI